MDTTSVKRGNVCQPTADTLDPLLHLHLAAPLDQPDIPYTSAARGQNASMLSLSWRQQSLSSLCCTYVVSVPDPCSALDVLHQSKGLGPRLYCTIKLSGTSMESNSSPRSRIHSKWWLNLQHLPTCACCELNFIEESSRPPKTAWWVSCGLMSVQSTGQEV